MSDYDRHLQAIENRCRICLQKKSRENLRTFNQNLIQAIQDAYNIDYENESQLSFYPQHVCKGCASSILKGRPPNLATLNYYARKVTTKHSGIGCSICETFTGEVGRPLIPQKCLSMNLNSDPDVISDVEAGPSPPPKRICWSSSDELDVCKHCLSDQKIGHECNRQSLIQNSLELLERKGIADEVVATLLRRRAIESKSPEFEVNSLRIRVLNGRYGKQPEPVSVSKEDLAKLVSEICLSIESLRKLCTWMKACGIKTPSSRSVFANKDEISGIFSEIRLNMQHRISNSDHEEGHGYIEKETEIVYCNNVETLISLAEDSRSTPSNIYRWGLDHGKGYLKVVLQPTHGLHYKDSVKGCLLVAVTKAPETRENLRKIFELLPTLDLTKSDNVFTSDLKVVNMVCGLLGGAAKFPCPYCTFCWTTEEEGFSRTWNHYENMAHKIQEVYDSDTKHAKDCFGVATLPLLKFENPKSAFPIAAVHAQLGLREKFVDRLAKKLLGDVNYRKLELEWIEPLVGPAKQYHGGSYTGRASVKILENSNKINLQLFPELEPLVPVMNAAAQLVHSVCGKELKPNWESSIHNFRAHFSIMRTVIEEKAIQEYNASNSNSNSTQELNKVKKHVKDMTKPTPKIHFLLYHLQEYLESVNCDKLPDEKPFGLGYFSEQVLESCHHNFAKFNNFYTSGDTRLQRATVNYNLLHLNFIEELELD